VCFSSRKRDRTLAPLKDWPPEGQALPRDMGKALSESRKSPPCESPLSLYRIAPIEGFALKVIRPSERDESICDPTATGTIQ
jgi:hypothetical protein